MGPLHPGLPRVRRHPDPPGRHHRQAGCAHPARGHLDAPRHAPERARFTWPSAARASANCRWTRFFGTGVVLDVPKGEWEYIEPADLDAAGEVRPGDIVVLNTGWHRNYSDNMEYFGHGPGLSEAAARWLADRQVKIVAIDTATIDHPLATRWPSSTASSARTSSSCPGVTPSAPAATSPRTSRPGARPESCWPRRASPRSRTSAVTWTRSAASGPRSTPIPWFWPEADACIIRLRGHPRPLRQTTGWRVELMPRQHRRPALLQPEPPRRPQHGPVAVPVQQAVRRRTGSTTTRCTTSTRSSTTGSCTGARTWTPRRTSCPTSPSSTASTCRGSSAPAWRCPSRRGKWGVITPEDLEKADAARSGRVTS